MSLETRKLEVMQELLLTHSESLLEQVHQMLRAGNDHELTEGQKAELDARRSRYRSGESKAYSLEEAKAMVCAPVLK